MKESDLAESKALEEFYIVCPPGWEEDLGQELFRVWPLFFGMDGRSHAQPFPELKLEKGGVSLRCPFFFAAQICFFSRLASRVLWRMDHFPCRQFSQLEALIKKSRWARMWLKQVKSAVGVNLKVAATSSKLANEKRIAEVFWQTLDRQVFLEDGGLGVYLRAEDDFFTLSVDLAGDHLHVRGDKPLTAVAPLRSTLAARMLQHLLSDIGSSEIAEWTFWDPMAGSGTLGLEAKNFRQPVFSREFAFQKWASTATLLRSPLLEKQWPDYLRLKWKEIWMSDLDITRCATLQSEFATSSHKLRVFAEDFFQISKTELPQKPFVMCFNPPYGERLPTDFNWAQLVDKAVSYRPDRLGLLVPDSATEACRRGRLQRRFQTQNGGLAVSFWTI
jgi:23S rRNA G2445 N2-methylase RlmL